MQSKANPLRVRSGHKTSQNQANHGHIGPGNQCPSLHGPSGSKSAQPSDGERLIGLIGAEVSASKALINALEYEFTALKSRDNELLDKAISEKQRRAAAVQRASEERAHFVETELGTNALLDTALAAPAPIRDKLLRAISELRQVAEHVAVRNQTNGRLLTMSQQAAELLLGAMRNEQPATATYSAQGQMPETVFSRPLAKA